MTASAHPAASPDGESERPNIIWIFGDQHRAQATGYAGDPNAHTPVLDRMVAEGTSMNGISGTPLCCPYRGSLLSGLYPHKAVPGHEEPLDPTLPTVATHFKAGGYDTSWFGKWHVDGWHERDGRSAFYTVPPDHRGGFDTWLGYENNNAQHDCWLHGHDEVSPGDRREVEHYRLPGYETDDLTDLLIRQIRRNAELNRPFFAGLSVQPPHDPYVAPREFALKYNAGSLKLRPNVPAIPRVEQQARRELAGYYAMIENLDYNVGRVLDALVEVGLSHNTFVVFFSDHGDMHGSQGQFRKTSPWEESVRVPMIVYHPGGRYVLRGGQHQDLLVNHVDMIPTSLGLAGLKPTSDLPGHDFSGHVVKRGQAAEPPDSAFLQLVNPTRHGDSTDRPWRGIVTRDDWKYVCLEGQPWLMFNLNEDPYEQANLAHNTRFAAKRRELHDRLARWIKETGDSFALPSL